MGAIIGVGSAIIGALVGALIGYRLSISLSNITAFNEAGRKLREAFYDELATLDGGSIKDIDAHDILEIAFKKHMIAFWEFNVHIAESKRSAFNQAWQKYHCCPKTDIHLLEQYDTVTGSMEQREKNRKLAIKNIQDIISFTNK